MYGEYNPNTIKTAAVSVNDSILQNGTTGKLKIGKGAVGASWKWKNVQLLQLLPYYGIRELINDGSIKTWNVLSNVADGTVGMYRAGELDPALLSGQVSQMTNNGTVNWKRFNKVYYIGKTRTLPSTGGVYYNK